MSHTTRVIIGLVTAAIVLGVAHAIGFSWWMLLAVTQSSFLVCWVPVILIAFFTVVVMMVIGRDAKRRKESRG